ncbi:MAG: iron-sulfur cluster assembly protein [Candidatus Poribacteria bacterium]|nr:iron-sulfur cluster assembly protein [Candidatus Poribacteria bacterium]
MSDNVQLSIPASLDREIILERLDRVLDPELDEPIVKLGFVKSLEAENGHLTIELHLPTYWCAPNFSYLMAEGARRELLTVESIQEVTVRLPDHFASKAIEAGVNAGKSFVEAFPEEASGNLGQLQDLFFRKGYIKRQEQFLRHLRNAGLSLEAIAALRIADVSFADESFQVRHEGGCVSHVGPAEVAQRYLERRAELGLDCSPTAPLVMNLRGNSIPPEKLEEYLIRARTVRVSLEANGVFCSAVLAARKTETNSVS